jgi:hypothetical protein
MSISIKRALPLTWSNNSVEILGPLPPRPLLIVPGFLLTQLLLQLMLMILPHNFVGRKHIRASLAASDGWPQRLGLTWRRCTLSSRLTIANRLLATCVLLSTFSTIFTRLTTLGYTSHRLLQIRFTRLFTSWILQMLRLIRMPSHLYRLTRLLSLPTVMPVGALKLGLRFVTVLCFLYSNVGA